MSSATRLNRRPSLPGTCEETHYDFLDSKQFRAYFPRPHVVEHHSYFSDHNLGIRDHIKVERWHRRGEIGRGGFGTVHLEIEEKEHPPQVRAVKEIPKAKCGQETLAEILTMAKMSKDDCFFIRLHGWFQDQQYFYIAMDYYPLGDLGTCLPEPQTLPESEAEEVASDINSALTMMHKFHFTHRDLKPSNIFVVQKSPRWWVKLGDFGVAKRVRDDSTGWHTCIDTPFSAPEVLGFGTEGSENSSTYTNAVDMWSLGFLIHWLLTGQVPLQRAELQSFCFGKMQMPTERLKEKQVSEEVIDLVQSLLRPRPEDRLDCRRTQDHPWFQGEGAIATNQHAGVTRERSAASKQETWKAIAIWDYDATSNNEVSIKKGDLVSILEKPNPEWWTVKTQAGKKGYVFSRLLKEISQKRQAPLEEQQISTVSVKIPCEGDLLIPCVLPTATDNSKDRVSPVETRMETGYSAAGQPIALSQSHASAAPPVERVSSASCTSPSIPQDISIDTANASRKWQKNFNELPKIDTRSYAVHQREQSEKTEAIPKSLRRSKDVDNDHEHHHRRYTAPAYPNTSLTPTVYIERPEPRSFLSEQVNAAGRSSRAVSEASILQSPPDHFASTPDAARSVLDLVENSITGSETRRDPSQINQILEQRIRRKPVSADMGRSNLNTAPATSLPFPNNQDSFLARISQHRSQNSTTSQLPQLQEIYSPRPVRPHQLSLSTEPLAPQTAVSTPNTVPSRSSKVAFYAPPALPLTETRRSVDSRIYRPPLKYDDFMAREYPGIPPRSAPVTHVSSDYSSSYFSYMSGSPLRKTASRKARIVARVKKLFAPKPKPPTRLYHRGYSIPSPGSRGRISTSRERRRRSTAHPGRPSTSLPRVMDLPEAVRPPPRPATTSRSVDSNMPDDESSSSDESDLEAYATVRHQRRLEQDRARLARETASWWESIDAIDRRVAAASGARGAHLV